jgi:Amt family ammonium transporter
MLMTPGLAFFYGGLVRGKNALATVMQSFIIVALVSVQWVLWGYSLAFGPDKGYIIGGLEWVGLKSVGMEAGPYSPAVPHLAYMIFQGMFAVITPALITGAFAERMKFSTFLVFTLLWATLVYDPVAHWVWGGGWLAKLGILPGLEGNALDFAGGTVVHINSGVAALAAAFVFGRRAGFGSEPMEPHNVVLVVLGASLLWFGWFGFNAGSAIVAGGLAANAFVVTNTATAMAALSWMAMSWLVHKKPSVVGAASGAVAGLVAITPASGFVEPMPALIIGLVVGIVSFLAVQLRARWRLDDSLDVWAVHGMGGTWGALATGIFAAAAIGGVEGVWHGNPGQFANQMIAVAATWIYSFTMTFVILKILDKLMGLRVTPQDEAVGLDVSQHGEPAYR